jgi:nicotinamidase-related amidase
MKRLLIVVDYQNDFVSGSLGFSKAEELESRIDAKIKEYRQGGDEIVFTFDTHNDNYLNTQEGRNLPVAHCISNTEGWNLYGAIADLKNADDRCFVKNCFGSSELFSYLLDQSYASIELCGVVTNICVISNAILAKTALPEIPVIIDAACVASNDDSLNEKALDVMESLQVKIINR